jgi:uncharacterized protein YsxB (DUF464 family)
MITVEVIWNKDEVTSIFISGHSGYDELGKDIVCSSVSTAAFVSVGLLEKFKCDFKFDTNESKPKMKLEIIKTSEITNNILNNLVETFEGIVIDYSPYLKIKEIRR